MKIQVDFYITLSKIAAFLILILCSIYSFINKESSVIILGVTICAGLLGFKSYQTTNRIKYENNKVE